jgi:CO/xanthine dehydrogenase FAD-binding subunit
MKPPVFDYQRAENIEHACELLSAFGTDSKILAGGQTLIPMMNFRLARPQVLIDISNIPDRNQVTEESDGIRIRATSVQRFVEQSAAVQRRLPILHNAIQHIAHFQIRNKGTIGGSISNADPASELPAMSMLLDAELTINSTTEERIVPAEEFFVTYMTTSLAPDEILSSILFKEPPKNSGWGFHEVARRSGDFALAGSSAVVTLDAGGKCTRARIALFGVAATPVRAIEAEEMMIGEVYSENLLRAVAQRVQDVVDPESDVHVTKEYRRSVAEVLTVRALDDGFRRAGGRR